MLANKKVYVGKHSREIQEKAFELGCEWSSGRAGVQNLDAPFLYFDNKFITYGDDVIRFNTNKNEEITAEEILAMEVPKPKKTIRDLYPLSGFSVDEDGNIREVSNASPHYSHELWNVLPSKEEAEAYKILPFLLQWRDRYNEGWKPDWKSNIVKYVIYFDCDKIYADITYYETCLFSFECEEIRDKFLEDFREELEIVKPLF